MKPQVLPPNVLDHFYAGGARIAALRGLELASDHTPEEWIGAVNTTFDGTRGLSRFADGTLVRDAIAADPQAYLGREGEPGLLVKLLDAGQRLPVHFHPGREFAAARLGSAYGKTEAWLIVEADDDARIWAGWNRDVTLDEARAWMREQAADAMLAAMHELPVAPGDAVYVPAGTIHAIGAGILMVELQEPTDFSICLEWEGFELGEDDCHLDLGWDVALQALDTSASAPPTTTLPPEAGAFFRADWLDGDTPLDQGFSILVGLDGAGTLAYEAGELPFARGTAVLVPHAAGQGALRGGVRALRARPAR